MTKWTLPEGRKPLTDADIAALTRRLASTAVDCKELYEAAKRDAEEAEAYAAELEKERDEWKSLAEAAVKDDASKNIYYAELQVKLVKALEALGCLEVAATGAGVPHPKERELLHTCIRNARAVIAGIEGDA